LSAAASLLVFLSRAIDDIATGLARVTSILRRRRRIALAEQANGAFLWRDDGSSLSRDQPPLLFDKSRFPETPPPGLRKLLAGSQVDVLLAPTRFVFRPLELPRAAGAFIEGVVRAQIDRLSPWTADTALFGWSAPVDVGPDKIALTVGATARAQVDPIAEWLLASGAASVEMSTRVAESERPVILKRRESGEMGTGQLRVFLIAGLAAVSLVFAASFAAWIAIGAGYESRLSELRSQLAELRVKLAGEQGSEAMQALNALEGQKRSRPSAVLILESLSKTLPDDAHLTDLRIEGEKLQIVGFADHAPALIPLIEQSGGFATATFFAPTVRGPTGGDNFHIEARIEPPFPPAPVGSRPPSPQ
jgi:general secretion pathway protein L